MRIKQMYNYVCIGKILERLVRLLSSDLIHFYLKGTFLGDNYGTKKEKKVGQSC
jgi:hypothetical protein